MAPDDWPEWLPSDWTVQIRKIDERKVKCYLDPKGQKFYSKPQVFRHLKTIDGSTASEKTHNANGSTGDVSLEPNVPHTNEVGGHSTRQATGSSNKKSKETSGNLAGDGSSSEAEGSQRKDGWLPDGWIVQVKTRASGGHTGMKYKCFTDPITGRKFFSKPQVLNYLASKNGSPAGPREGDRSSTKPNKSQKNGATDVNKDQTIKKTESTRFGYEVISSAPADGLPPGWIKEIRLRNCGSLKKKDPFYVDPLSGYIFFSKLDALRYLDSGDIKKCAMRPLRKDMNEEDYHNANLAGGELASPTDPSKGSQTSEVLSNGRDKRKVRRLSGVGSTPIASQKDESDWLPEGWISEVKVRSNGLRLKYFMESASGRKFYSKPQVLNYLANGNASSNSRKRKIRTDTGGQLAVDPDSSSNSEAADGRRRKRSKKKKKNVQNSTFKEFVTASPADGLPPGWIKEIRTRKYSTHERKDPYYTDPESGFIFRSKLDALRYLETGDINLCAIRPRKKDENGNEITVDVQTPGNATARKQLFEENSTVKQQNAQIHDENHVTDPKTAENTSVSTPPSGRAAKKIAQSRITSRSKSSAAAVPARSSKRLKGPQTEAKGDPMSNDQTIQSESRDLPADDGRGVQEKQVSGVNVEKQAGGEDDLSYQLGDPSWTDQCLDFAVKTLTGEFPVSGRQTSGSFQEGSDGAETGVNETPTKVN
ncbi:uncharacterized protein LOC112529248 isoform X2 [Cynara cardunculus var. scolymus]|uniref:uncharacterized protein LOC112529248 isoform X2 n=1 Tax=Cynara cardunculus var. scolymus TaxID=59895 RepID=UPI000D62C25B|nr:uncharacterized protein LOC112529248 isoform X2 [Cynara cardunculus var. scolymus]